MKDKPTSRLRRWLKRGAFTLALLITLIAAVVVFENWRGHRAWQKYRAEQEAKGEVFDWRKLLPAPVPDDQNFIKTPFLAPLTERDIEAQQRLSSTFLWQAGLRGRGYWRKAEITDWATLQLQLRSKTNSEQPEVQTFLQRDPIEPHEDVLFLFSQYETRMDELRNAAKRPYSSFNSRYDEGFDEFLGVRVSALKNLALAFTLKSRAELAAGNSSNALEDFSTAVVLSRSLNSEPLGISLLIKLGLVENLLNPIWEGLALGRWSDLQLFHIQNTLRGVNLVADAKHFFEGERAVSLVVLDQMLRPNGSFAVNQLSSFRDFQKLSRFRKLLLPRLVAHNKISICRMYSDYIFPLLDPEDKAVHIRGLTNNEQNAMSLFEGSHPYQAMVRAILPSISEMLQRISRAQTAVNLAMVAVALERHRLAEGGYPAELSALAPRFLPKLPADLDDKPLRYRMQADGTFVLYSIGSDLVDDQARVGASDGKFTTEKGDWVWKYPGPPASFE